MTYFDYLETQWVQSQKRLNVPPAEMTIANQSRMNAVQQLIDMSRAVIKWAYIGLFLSRYLFIKLRLKQPPQYESSIPAQPGPTLVKPEPTPPTAA